MVPMNVEEPDSGIRGETDRGNLFREEDEMVRAHDEEEIVSSNPTQVYVNIKTPL